MFLSYALYEILDPSGRIESFHIYPTDSPRLVTDKLADVEEFQHASEVDLGPLRFYTTEGGLRIQRTTTRLSSNSLQVGRTLRFEISHRGLPVAPDTIGFYGILLPPDYYGDVRSELDLDQVWLSDVKRLLITCELNPWTPHWNFGLTLSGRLAQGDSPESNIDSGSSFEIFKNGLSGLHHSSVANFLRAVNRSLGESTPQVFLCHSSTDKEKARNIATALAGRGIRVWLDKSEIRVGDSLIGKIEQGIINSDRLIVLLSKNSVASNWCKEELRMALAMQISRLPIRVLPALLEDCEIPGFLKEKAYADFRESWKFDSAVEDLCDAIVLT